MKTLINKIIELVGEDFNGSVGFRADDSEYLVVGSKLQNSRFWDDGVETDEMLEGTSSILISADWQYDNYTAIKYNIEKFSEKVLTYGHTIAVIIGDIGELGEDIGELVIPNAKVLCLVNKSEII